MNARAALLSIPVLALAACGSSGEGGPPASAGVQVAIHPATAEVQAGASLKFQATVTGTADTGVE